MTTIPRPASGERFEGVVQVLIMLAIGAMAGAASFTHVHDVAVAHGQPHWIGWADATVVELMSIALGLELRRRARTHRPTSFVLGALLFFVLTSLAAQVVEAEPSVTGWLAAALPAIGFLVLVKVVLSRTATTTVATSAAAPDAGSAPEHIDRVDQLDAHHHHDRHDGQVDEQPTDETEPAPAELVPATVPVHLLPTARFAVVNHHQTTGRAITAAELATRMSITPATAGQLLDAVDATARINGTRLGTPT
jgi:hypothetical protein